MSNIDHQLDQLPHHTPDILWNQIRYESGRYDCRVERNGDHGQLIVTLVGLYHDHILHEEPVKIDRLDIDAWRIRSVSVICKPEAPLEGSVTANAGGELTGDREDTGQQELHVEPRPPMEIGNVWIHHNHPTQIHYMIHYTVDGQPEQRHLVELDGSALAKILATRIR